MLKRIFNCLLMCLMVNTTALALTPSTTTLSSSSNPSMYGSTVTFTAQVSGGGAGITSGAVSIAINGSFAGGCTLSNSAECSFFLNFDNVGTYQP